ncbi:MAG: hypothetical protein FWC51_02455 [Proteobacteria bacterium]|nr:hypothetical protein [Pseudomonadota bacterium]
MTRVYIVYPGLGKTTLTLRDARFVDLEARVFKDAELKSYIGKTEYPNVRGIPVKTFNPDYPENYFKFAKAELDAGKIILLVPKQDTYDLIHALEIKEYRWILPDQDRIEQLRAAQTVRGDNADYIEHNLGKRYQEVLDLANRSGKQILFLKPGQYLGDIF